MRPHLVCQFGSAEKTRIRVALYGLVYRDAPTGLDPAVTRSAWGILPWAGASLLWGL